MTYSKYTTDSVRHWSDRQNVWLTLQMQTINPFWLYAPQSKHDPYQEPQDGLRGEKIIELLKQSEWKVAPCVFHRNGRAKHFEYQFSDAASWSNELVRNRGGMEKLSE